jgi:hypothetical protein
MKMIKSGKTWALVRVKTSIVQKCSCDGRIARSDANLMRMDGSENCAFTFAKMYYKGGGIWQISGYNSDGSDFQRVIDKMKLEESNGELVRA